jgi:superfamily I DNA and/or RNA helicase
LRHRDDIAPYSAGGRNLVHVYDYPEQLHAFAAGDAPYVLDAERPRGAGTIVNIDDEALQLHLKVSGTVDAATVDALTAKPAFDTKGLRAALLRVARAYRDGRLSREHRALEDVLLARAPRAQLNAGSLGAVALSLDESYLFVQGPPGSGKSTKGAAMVVDLLAAGKRVAILANAHKAIHNLLHKIESEAERRGVAFSGIQRYSNETQMYTSTLEHPYVTPHPSNDALTQEHNLAAGTAWVFSRDELVAQYDYLVIDEAGQVSLANAIACAPCARNIVLLGDPLQLAQVSQGAHPVGLEASILEHLLAGATTVPEQRGIFLDESYRMHPAICDFISEAVYGGRLHAAPETRDHAVDSAGLHGSGLRFLPVTHAGNTQESPEEADAIAREIALLVQGTYHLRAGAPQPLDPGAILVVSPYNAQRRLLRATLRDAGLERVRVGTVDAFQGQQAPVVFYSMATSSGDDVPRSLGFLFEKNRLNVAVSRAQCMSVVVCSPRLLEAHCSTPEQMSLVNLLCRFVEAATA